MDQNIWRARRKWAQTTKLSCWTWRTTSTSLFKSGLKYIRDYCLEFAGSSLLMVFFLKWQNLLKCIWALHWSHTDLGCRGGSDLTSGKELLTLTKIRDLWEHSLLFASTLSVLERASWLNQHFPVGQYIFAEGGGWGRPFRCVFLVWCGECDEKLPFLDCSSKGRGAIPWTTFRGFLNRMALKFVALWIQP